VSFIKNDEGAAMVEFAIASSIFIVTLLAILGFGFESWVKSSLAADAREGTRYAMVRGSTAARIATADSVSNYVKSKSNLGSSLVVVTTWTPDNTPGSTVTVKVRYAVPRGPFFPAHTDSSTSTQVIIF
jgi:Flp pilus assembly protein TadG